MTNYSFEIKKKLHIAKKQQETTVSLTLSEVDYLLNKIVDMDNKLAQCLDIMNDDQHDRFTEIVLGK